MASDCNKCLLEPIRKCTHLKESLVETTHFRIQRVISSSKQRNDSFHKTITDRLELNPDLKLFTHRNCVTSYTSSFNISRVLKRQTASTSTSPASTSPTSQPAKRLRTQAVAGFSFKEHCLFCGQICELKPNPKNPKYWKKAFLCRTADRPGKRQFKHAVLEECIRIDDQQSRDVQLRVSGAVSDLHAAEARYHDKCSKLFFLRTFATPQQRHESQEDTFRQLIHTIRVDRTRMWTSVDVERTYTELGGTSLSRPELIKRVTSDLDNEIVVLSSPGLAHILIFRDKASTLLRLVETTDTDDRNIDAVSKTITKECKNIPINKDVYSPDISIHHAEKESSNTLLRLLSKISDKLNNTLSAYLIANIVTSTIQNKYTSLQIALGVMTRKKTDCRHSV